MPRELFTPRASAAAYAAVATLMLPLLIYAAIRAAMLLILMLFTLRHAIFHAHAMTCFRRRQLQR